MNSKKVFRILLLIIFIVGICFTVVQIKKKSDEQKAINRKVQENRETSEEVIEIKDEYFISMTNDFYYNLDSYVGKTIKMQGLVYEYNINGKKCYAVVRNAPGCCGNDGLAGLDIKYDGNCPPPNTWVEIVGVVKKEERPNGYNPIVNVTSMEEKAVGQTFVTN